MQRVRLRRGSASAALSTISTGSLKSKPNSQHQGKLGRFFSVRKRSSSVTDGMIRESVDGSFLAAATGKDRDEGGRLVHVMVTVPDGSKHVLTGEHGSKLSDVLVDLAMEYQLYNYKVYMASSRMLLNPDAEAKLLDGVDICLEDGDLSEDVDPRIAHEPRLRLLHELLRSEKLYQDSLRSIFEVYAEPLRKFSSLGKDDHKVLFFGLEPLLSLSNTLCLKLEDAIDTWESTATRIGNLFSKQFWYQYDEYYFSYPIIRQLLKEKRRTHEEFVEFCRLRRGAARHSLDSLLLLPVQRIPSYDKYLNELLEHTEETHPDYEDLNKAANKVRTMMREREDELLHIENEHKVESVQDRFPNDDLQLQDSQKQQKTKSLRSRRSSAPGAVLFRTLSKKHSSGGAGNTQSLSLIPDAARPGHSGSSSNRIYVLEGPVQLATGVQTQDRYLFLFNDLLLVAKQKNNTCFKLKHRVRVCEMWTASCVDEVSEVTRTPDKSFVIGWPTTNTVATFSNTDMRDLWYGRLTEQITAQKVKEEQKTVIKIVNKNTDMSSTSKCISVSNCEEARDIVARCMEEFHSVSGDPKDYQLWVRTGKEDAPYPLIGHEHPFSIKMSHSRDASGRGSLSSMEEDFFPLDINSGDTSSQVHFILRQSKKTPTKMTMDEGTRKSRKTKRSPFSNLFARRDKSKGPDSSHSSSSGKLFGLCLGDICQDDALPKPIMDLLHLLFNHGPYTPGIFRKSANAKKQREIRERLDHGEELPGEDEISVMVAAALLKDFMRSLGDCVFLCDLYDQWLETVDIPDTGQRLTVVKCLMSRLPKCHQNLLAHVMCVLYHIDQKSEENNMTSFNLAVCIGQSLLWPQHAHDGGGMSIHADGLSKVPMCIQFLIQHCDDIFEPPCSKLFGEAVPKTRQDSTDSDSVPSVLGLHGDHISMTQRDNSSLDSLDRDLYGSEIDSSPGLAKSHLSPTNLSRDSGLTLSDTQLYDEEAGSESGATAAAAATASHVASHKAPVARSVSHFEEEKPSEDPGMLSRSYDSTLESVGSGNSSQSAQGAPANMPVPPPRKHRNPRTDGKSTHSDNPHSQILRYSSSSQNMGDLHRAKRQAQFKKRRTSNDSLGSLDESSEVSETSSSKDDFQEYKEKHEENVFLHKSESGTQLFIGDDILNTAQYVDPFPPPPCSSESSPVAPGPVIRPTLGMHNIRRRRDQPPSPLEPLHEGGLFPSKTAPKSSRLGHMAITDFSASIGTPSTTSSQVPTMDFSASYDSSSFRTAKFQLQNESLDSSFGDSLDGASSDHSAERTEISDSASDSAWSSLLSDRPEMRIVAISEDEVDSRDKEQEARASSSPPASHPHLQPTSQLRPLAHTAEPTIQLRTRDSSNITKSAKSSQAHFSAPGRPRSPPPTVILRQAKVGMTPSGADIYPNRQQQKNNRRSLQEDQLLHSLKPFHESLQIEEQKQQQQQQLSIAGMPSRQALIKKPLLSGPLLQKAQRSESFGLKRAPGPTRVQRLHGVEKSASDTHVLKQFPTRPIVAKPEPSVIEQTRPAEPPSYQEAMQRKMMLQEQDAVSDVSEEDKLAQSVNSARARKLYEESLKMYENQGASLRDTGVASDSEQRAVGENVQTRRAMTRRARQVQRSSSLSRMGKAWRDTPVDEGSPVRDTPKRDSPVHFDAQQNLPSYEQACERAKRLKILAARARAQQSPHLQTRKESPSPPMETQDSWRIVEKPNAGHRRSPHRENNSQTRQTSSPNRQRVQRQKNIPVSRDDYTLRQSPIRNVSSSGRHSSPSTRNQPTDQSRPKQSILKSSRDREGTPPSSFRIPNIESNQELKASKNRRNTPPPSVFKIEVADKEKSLSSSRESTPPGPYRFQMPDEPKLKSSRNRESTPPSSFRVSPESVKLSRNRESTPPSSFRVQQKPEKEKSPISNRIASAPSSGQQQSHKREKTPTRRERKHGPRLSDTRLHSKSFDDTMSASSGVGLSRSKSDSSEHINKVGRFKQMTLAKTDSENKENNNRPTRAKSELILRDVERRSRSHTPERVLEEKQSLFEDHNLQRMFEERNLESKSRRRSINSVRNRDWHKELADQFKEEATRVPVQTAPKYTYTTNTKDLNEENGTKRRWKPPVHPTKDLIIDCSKDYSLRSASSNNERNVKSNSGSNYSRTSSAAAVKHTAKVDSGVVPEVVNRRPVDDSSCASASDSDSTGDSSGINWSVSKLSKVYDQKPKNSGPGKRPPAEQTNPNAEEAYV